MGHGDAYLLYILQVIDGLIFPVGDSYNEDIDVMEWLNKFISNGFEHILKLFSSLIAKLQNFKVFLHKYF